MNWLRLILEPLLFIAAMAAIVRGLKVEDAMLFVEGLFILWAWLFFLFVELKGWVRDLHEDVYKNKRKVNKNG